MRRHHGQHSGECGQCQDERDEYAKPEYRDDYERVMAEIERERERDAEAAEAAAEAARSQGL